MDDVMGLIDRAHHGDERARAQLVEMCIRDRLYRGYAGYTAGYRIERKQGERL